MNLQLEVNGKTITFKRLSTNQIPYLGYYDRYEEQVVGIDSTNTTCYIAKAKLSKTGKIVAISCIELI